MLTLSTPAGSPRSVATPAIAACSPSRCPWIASRKRSPASVSVSLRVLRWNSRTPRLRSSIATLRLTAAGVEREPPRSRREAAGFGTADEGFEVSQRLHALTFNQCL